MRANACATGAEVIVVTTNNRSYRRSANSAQHVALSQMSAAAIGPPGAARVDLGDHRGHRRRRRGAPHHRPVPQHGRAPVASRRRRARRRTCGAATGWNGRAAACVTVPHSPGRSCAAVGCRAAAAEPRRGRARERQRERRSSKAVELLVYAPIGLAMFAKDTVPTFMKMFVARGQTEIDHSAGIRTTRPTSTRPSARWPASTAVPR